MATCPLENQYDFEITITTTEMHTAGECVRIIESGFPVPQGMTILDKVKEMEQSHDDYRKLTLLEPRGHADMFGVLLVTPDHPEADLGVILMNNGGYMDMCGHACMSVSRYAVDKGLVRRPLTSPETQVNIQVPCGLVKAFVNVDSGPGRKSGRARIESVPSFVVATDLNVQMPEFGTITVDVSYGGVFYVFVVAKDLGLDFDTTSGAEFGRIGAAIKQVCKKVIPLSHPTVPAYLSGVVFIDSRDSVSDGPLTNLCIFADAQTDRSPCGSGVGARVTLLHHRGLQKIDQKLVFQNPLTKSQFRGRPVRNATIGDKKAIITEVEGHGCYTGKSTFHLENGDIIGRGFRVQ